LAAAAAPADSATAEACAASAKFPFLNSLRVDAFSKKMIYE
jgi:hypothetical protein